MGCFPTLRGRTTKLMDAPPMTPESNDAQPARSHAAHGWATDPSGDVLQLKGIILAADDCLRNRSEANQRLRDVIQAALTHITWPNADCAGAEIKLRAALSPNDSKSATELTATAAPAVTSKDGLADIPSKWFVEISPIGSSDWIQMPECPSQEAAERVEETLQQRHPHVKTRIVRWDRVVVRNGAVSFRTWLELTSNSLEHLLFIHENPNSVEAGFGPRETMVAVKEWLPDIKAALSANA